MLAFTQRLHSAEVERRDLRVEVTRLRKDNEIWTHNNQDVGRLQEELKFYHLEVNAIFHQCNYISGTRTVLQL